MDKIKKLSIQHIQAKKMYTTNENDPINMLV